MVGVVVFAPPLALWGLVMEEYRQEQVRQARLEAARGQDNAKEV